MDIKDIVGLEKRYVMQTYKRFPIVLEKGVGCYVFDNQNKKYLDFVGGIATCSIGHGNKELAEALFEQSKKLINTTNLYYTEPQILLAEKLSQLSELEKCFLCNSGAEAIETAIKLAKKSTKKDEFIAFTNGFHGRTMGALSATYKEKYREPFKPLVPGFKHVEYNNINALRGAITKNTAAVIVEPIQGEAGVIIPEHDYLNNIREVCDENGILMIVDEVQTGTGRTGKFFAYLHNKIKPDIVATAKGLGDGIPIGVTISNKDFDKGDHASTFGGNCLASVAGNFVIDFILKNNLMENAIKQGDYFTKRLDELKQKYDVIKEVRVKGLIIGIELKTGCKEIADKCLEKSLLVNCATEKTLRFLPPLIIKENEIDEGINILDDVLSTIK